MNDCYICKRKDTKYSCISCYSTICTVCADVATEMEDGYDESNYRVGRCPGGKCKGLGEDFMDDVVEGRSNEVGSNKKSGDEEGKQQSFHSFFKQNSRKRKTKTDKNTHEQSKTEINDQLISTKKAKGVAENNMNTNVNVAPDEKKDEVPETIVQPDNVNADERNGNPQKSAMFKHFKKIFPTVKETDIHNYHLCTERKCTEICAKDLIGKNSDNKFKHKWLFDPKLAKCDKTDQWCLVYIDGKGMFCSLCRDYNIKQNNGTSIWNSVANVRCRTQTVKDHFTKETSMHVQAVQSFERHQTSYFDCEEEKKTTALKNEVYYKVFQSLYWLAKEEIASSKCESLLTLIERMGVKEIKYFETRSEPILRKMLLLIATTIIGDIVDKIK